MEKAKRTVNAAFIGELNSPYILLVLFSFFFFLASGEKCKTGVMKNGCQNITAERHYFMENIKGQEKNVREIESRSIR